MTIWDDARASERATRGSLPRRSWLSTAFIALTALSLFLLFSVSPLVLAKFGFNYESSGGSPLEKFHPGTIIAVLALMCRIFAAPRPIDFAWRLLSRYPGLLFFVFVWFVLAGFVGLVQKVPATPLVDTFFLGVIFVLLLEDLDERIIRALAWMVAAILTANAFIALAEYLLGWRLIVFDLPAGVTSDPRRTDLVFDWRASLALEWRATALLGHPLQNGIIVGGFILTLAASGASWMPPLIRFPLLLLQAISMVTFGSRTAMVLSLALCAMVLLVRVGAFMAGGARINIAATASALLCVPALAVGGVVLAETGFFDRLIERFTTDAGSAQTRITMWELFRPLPWHDLLFGPDQEVVATWQRMEGLEFGIESFWVGFPLAYGIVMTTILVAGLFAFCWAVVRMSGKGAALVLLFFFAVASSSASISGKTTALGMTIPMILLFIRRDTAPLPPA